MSDIELFIRFGAAMAIGFSIGLQREFSHREGGKANGVQTLPAGERTFALIGLSGALAAMASDQFRQPLIFFGLLMAVGLLLVIGYVFKARNEHFGMTTEAAILVTVLLGGLCYWNYVGLAVSLGVITALILSIKLETDRLVTALTREDIFAALQFAVISAIVLPLLPSGVLFPPPFDVLDPFKIWLMVVFISGISFLGYVLIKLLDNDTGIGITGVLGGLVSSTAVTLALSRRSKEKGIVRALAVAIMVAWAIMFARILFQVAVLNLDLLRASWLPLLASGLTGFGIAAYLWFSRPRSPANGLVQFSNPFSLGTALSFGLIYALVLLVSRAAQLYLGDQGILLSSFIAGFADVNAITLTLVELANAGGLDVRVATQGLVLAAVTNTAFKGFLMLQLGSPGLRRTLLPGLIAVLAVAILAVWLF
ncbi:MAG: MgtC/SapB family protein [Anaerolineales bacterium]|nr:MgtC/SapB family protein [Anaerolineales bacterium]MCW5855668.1 MgtC/SapB family protein [Anaerolineales bacterium]